MTFRATNILPSIGLENAKLFVVRLKRQAELKVASLATGANSDEILGIVDSLIEAKNQLNAVKAITGIGQYAKDQENDQNYDVGAEFNALLATIDAAAAEIITTFPTDGSGFLLSHTLDASGRSPRTFPAGAVSGIKDKLQFIVDAIA